MEIIIETLKADPLRLVSNPVSDDDAPVTSEASLDSQIQRWDLTYTVAGFILFAAAAASVLQILVMIGHYMANSYYYEIPVYEPLIPWLALPIVGAVSGSLLFISNNASKRIANLRDKLYISVPQGRIVKMDMRGERPYVAVEGYNARNQIRTQWHAITIGEWENWLFKYMKRGIYVDFRAQDDAGE